jgi:predicted DNA-binding ArsR family transcriptional regulator
MFGNKKPKAKHKKFGNFKAKKRSSLDKVIDILDAASNKDKQSAYKPKKKVKHKMKETNKSNWNPQISW